MDLLRGVSFTCFSRAAYQSQFPIGLHVLYILLILGHVNNISLHLQIQISFTPSWVLCFLLLPACLFSDLTRYLSEVYFCDHVHSLTLHLRGRSFEHAHSHPDHPAPNAQRQQWF